MAVATAVAVFASWVGPDSQPSVAKPRPHSPLSLRQSVGPEGLGYTTAHPGDFRDPVIQ